MSGEIKSGWNLPPGVFDNDPHFNGDEPEYDLQEIKSFMEKLEEAMATIDEAGDFLIKNGVVRESDFSEEPQGLFDEFEYIKKELEDQGWY